VRVVLDHEKDHPSRWSTVSDKAASCPLERVNRQFRVPAPNMLWVSDFTPAFAGAGSM
jgi:hypothetical protein